MDDKAVERIREARSAKYDELDALERAAGLEAAMKTARAGSLFPLGIDGAEVSTAEYDASEFDHTRRKTRRVYFGVSDRTVQRELMRTVVEIERLADREMAAALAQANREVAKAEAALDVPSWGMAAIVAAAVVAAGYWCWQLPGAMAGMVGGFFLGQGVIARERAAARAQLRSLRADRDDCAADAQRLAAYPPSFSEREIATGEPDPEMSAASAYGAVVAAQARASGLPDDARRGT